MIPFVLLQTQQSLPFLCSRKCFCIPALRNLLLWARVYFSRLYSPLGQEPHLIYYPICYTSCTQLSSVAQSCPTLCDIMDCSTPGFTVHQNSQSLLRLKLIELVMSSNHLILCLPLLLPPSVFASIRVFSSESALQVAKVLEFQL